jgi:hypothetical protein
MHFRLSLIIQQLSLHPAGVQPIELTVRREHPLDVVIEGPAEGDATCVVTAHLEPPKKVAAALEALAADRMPDNSRPRDEWDKDHEYINKDGAITGGHRVPLSLMPPVLQDFVRALSAEMTQAARDAVGVLRWRTRTLGPRQPFASNGMSWSFDGETWLPMPRNTMLSLHADTRLEMTDGAVAQLQALLDDGEAEPLAHELFREAWSQRENNPRSALLIGVTSLETGVKSYISHCVPDARWLAEEAPSPPVVSIMTDYLPTLQPPGGPGVTGFDDELVKVLKVAIGLRNKLTHRGEDVSTERVQLTLRAVRNVLWTLDGARGHSWAETYVLPLNRDPSSGFLKA